MSEIYCKICGEMKLWSSHTCPPSWYCMNGTDYDNPTEFPTVEDIEDSGERIYSIDAERAAIRFAEVYQGRRCWYPEEMIVFAMDFEGKKLYRYIVYQESQPRYYVSGPDILDITHSKEE